MPRVTSRDVAREAGVSQTTVSFVLNGRDEHGIAERTRELVLDTAERLGYVPSAAARSLRAGKSNIVVCLVPDLPVTEAMEVLRREFSAALGQSDYTCVFLETAGTRRPLSEVWQHIWPAAVVALGELPADQSGVLRRANIPLLDGVLQPDEAVFEGLDQHEIGSIQVRHLAELGHQFIGFAAIDDPRETPFCKPRLDGARAACHELGLEPPVVTEMTYSSESASKALNEWLSSANRVTGVAAFNDLLALSVLGACTSRGVNVPTDLALIGVDDLPTAAVTVPALSTVAMDLSIPALKLADRVLNLIDGRDPRSTGNEGPVLRLVRREST